MPLIASLLLLLSLTACTPKPPDVPVCQHLGQRIYTDENGHTILAASPTCMREIKERECGHCTFIVSGKELYLGEHVTMNGKKWSQLRLESILVPSEESYAPIATYMINSCKKMNCSTDITKFKIKVDSVATKP